MLICTTGLPGSGKSTVADLLKEELERNGRKVRHYTSDWMRFKLFPKLVGNSAHRGRDFTQDELERSYNGLYLLFEELLSADPALVIITDGTYRKESQRNSLREIARRHKVPFVLIKVCVDEAVAIARLNERLAAGEGSGPESYLSAKAVYEELSNALVLKNNADKEALKKEVRILVKTILQQSTGATT
jgi:predicted kinase